MSGAAFSYELTILEHHLDTFSHVNNATYLELLEEARWDFITRNGYGVRTVHELGQGPVILEIGIRFLKELRLRQRIRIRSWLSSYTGKICVIHQVIENADGGTERAGAPEIHCEAELKGGLFDLRARKLVPPTPQWLAAIGWKVTS